MAGPFQPTGIATPRAMTVSKTAVSKIAVSKISCRSCQGAPFRPQGARRGDAESTALQMGELSELLGYSLKRAQLKVFEDFLRCVAPLQLTPAQFSVLLLLDRNPGRNQTEIANTLGILRPNFVAMLDGLESRDLCARMRSTNDRRSHILVLTDKGRAVLARAKNWSPPSTKRVSMNCWAPPTAPRCWRCWPRSPASFEKPPIRHRPHPEEHREAMRLEGWAAALTHALRDGACAPRSP